ncbi:hypothetical protein IWQ61_003212 [Dispira simplex]|nr:hypothetical protein IWQ61_003212 [Dispira simplex]
MPRYQFNTLTPSTIVQRLTGTLRKLPTEGTSSNAQQEIRWLMDHAVLTYPNPTQSTSPLNLVYRQPTTARWHFRRGRGCRSRIGSQKPHLPSPSLSTSDVSLSYGAYQWLRQAVWQRVHHRKPLQYLLGSQPFGELDILTQPPTLIPRWETEEWTLQLASQLNQIWNNALHQTPGNSGIRADSNPRPFRILDLCTGTGCIALSFAHTLQPNTVRIIGVDIATTAYRLAQRNLTQLRPHLRNPVAFLCADALSSEFPHQLKTALDGLDSMESSYPVTDTSSLSVDMVVMNPPYISPEEYRILDAEVQQWEDPISLVPLTATTPTGETTHSPGSTGTKEVTRSTAESLAVADDQDPLGVAFYLRIFPYLFLLATLPQYAQWKIYHRQQLSGT